MASSLPDLTTQLAALHQHVFGSNGVASRPSTGTTSRHDLLKKRAVTLSHAKIQPESVLAELRLMNKSFEAPKPDEEIEKLARWAAAKIQPAAADPKRTQSEQLVDFVRRQNAEHIRDSRECAYIGLPGDTPRIYPVRSRQFRVWLAGEFYADTLKTPSAAALTDAVTTLEGIALYGADSISDEVALRVSGDTSAIAIDLGDDTWRCAVVTAEGWKIEPHGRHRFRRSPQALSLPEPKRGGDFRRLRHYVRVDDIGWTLLAPWMLAALCPFGPYPILPFFAEQGCGKTFATRLIRNLIDPSAAGVRSEPKDVRDLSIAAANSWILALDNVSKISPEISDVLCRISTGGGFATRTLYSDADETIFDYKRPTILTAIEDVVARPDLLDRAVTVRLQPIPEDERRTEADLLAEFEVERPYIFGAMLDALSLGLREMSRVKRETRTLPRMADFAVWACATEPSYTVGESFTDVYAGSRLEAHTIALDGSPIVIGIKKTLAAIEPEITGARTWTGTTTDLYARLIEMVDDETRRLREWPRSARAFANALRRIAPSLRSSAGIEVDMDIRVGHDRKRVVVLTMNPSEPMVEPRRSSKRAQEVVEV